MLKLHTLYDVGSNLNMGGLWDCDPHEPLFFISVYIYEVVLLSLALFHKFVIFSLNFLFVDRKVFRPSEGLRDVSCRQF